MELENLRSAWEVHTSDGKSHLIISESAIDKILEEKTKKAKRQVTKRMTIDAAFMIIVVFGFSFLLYFLELKATSWGIVFLVSVAMLLFVHYHFNSVLLNRNNRGESVLEEVNRSLKIIRRYTFVYQWIFPLILGVFSYFGWQFGIYDIIGIESSEISQLQRALFSALFSIICWLLLSIITRWSFGKQIQGLDKLRTDLSMKA